MFLSPYYKSKYYEKLRKIYDTDGFSACTITQKKGNVLFYCEKKNEFCSFIDYFFYLFPSEYIFGVCSFGI